MPIFQGYFGETKITDGMRSLWTSAEKIHCRNKNGTVMTIKTREYRGHGQVIWEYKCTRLNRILEWTRFGAFHRFYHKTGKKLLRYHPNSLRTLHGIADRTDVNFFGVSGTCKTLYSRGRFMRQQFRYKNRKLAFNFHHCDKQILIKYPNGKFAGIVSCPGKGFSTRGGNPDRYVYSHGEDRSDTHTCFEGAPYFETTKAGWKHIKDSDRELDFSKDGNCQFTFYNPAGSIKAKGEFKNRQKVGEWILNGKHVYFINGVAVAKKLWDTPPEKLNINTILRLKNAQMRAALLARIGTERIAKECKHKIIHQTKNGMKLMEFPIKVDDGNGHTESHLRILQVTCPSTKNKYYLNIPDFVWDGGKKTKLDTCEQARQWTFGVNNPGKKIKFALET